ncbi:hypothetical protein OED01_12060 [Microbacterium sp. M28]|uniref:hypothetical protein n=1 Tax=Microbacterium sp. M28 TaxID=2962064 RepID=UPI0021F473DE|nr:hypothetical protein [Microbacterium sp. M28]UYO96331.1 hypothetical protein OED01_12060 [Microbacterium sp. M28]
MREADAAELASLRAKAYGPNGSLTDAEAERLRELQDATRTPDRVADPAPGASQTTDPVEPVEPEEPATGPVDDAQSPPPRRRRLIPAAVIALAVVVGTGVGWALATGASSSTIELTSQQQEWQDALAAAGEYDEGSLRAIAVDTATQISGDASPVVWAATKDHGAELCVIVGDADGDAATCAEEYVVRRDSLVASYPRADAERDSVTITTALALISPDGELTGRLSTHWIESSEAGPVSADALARDTALISREFVVESFEVVGAFEEYPVWLTTIAGGQSCLTYVGESGGPFFTCTSTQGVADAPLRLDIISHDMGEPDGAGERTTFELTFPDPASRQLLITRTPEDEIQPIG